MMQTRFESFDESLVDSTESHGSEYGEESAVLISYRQVSKASKTLLYKQWKVVCTELVEVFV